MFLLLPQLLYLHILILYYSHAIALSFPLDSSPSIQPDTIILIPQLHVVISAAQSDLVGCDGAKYLDEKLEMMMDLRLICSKLLILGCLSNYSYFTIIRSCSSCAIINNY